MFSPGTYCPAELKWMLMKNIRLHFRGDLGPPPVKSSFFSRLIP